MVLRRLLTVTPLAGLLGPPIRSGAVQTLGTATGSIEGTVIDAGGENAAGGSVSVFGEALMGRAVMLTDADGRFRFLALPPGAYTIVFARTGFPTLRRDGRAHRRPVLGRPHQRLDIAPVVLDGDRGAAGSNRRRAGYAVATAFDADQLASLPGTH